MNTLDRLPLHFKTYVDEFFNSQSRSTIETLLLRFCTGVNEGTNQKEISFPMRLVRRISPPVIVVTRSETNQPTFAHFLLRPVNQIEVSGTLLDELARKNVTPETIVEGFPFNDLTYPLRGISVAQHFFYAGAEEGFHWLEHFIGDLKPSDVRTFQQCGHSHAVFLSQPHELRSLHAQLDVARRIEDRKAIQGFEEILKVNNLPLN